MQRITHGKGIVMVLIFQGDFISIFIFWKKKYWKQDEITLFGFHNDLASLCIASLQRMFSTKNFFQKLLYFNHWFSSDRGLKKSASLLPPYFVSSTQIPIRKRLMAPNIDFSHCVIIMVYYRNKLIQFHWHLSSQGDQIIRSFTSIY